MKKFTFVLAAALCMTASLFAERVTNLNPYAYGVSTDVDESMIAVQYKLNVTADSTAIIIYRDGQEVGAVPVENNAFGLHTEVVDLSEYTQGGTYSLGIRVFGTSYAEPTVLKEAAEGSTDTVPVFYGFDHPKGVDVDNNPFSPNFGRILTDECMEKAGSWYSKGVAGIYAFDPTFSPIANGNVDVFRDTTYSYSLSMNCEKSAYAPYRIRISKDNRIFVSLQDDKASSLYELSADLQTWTPIFAASMTDGEALDGDGKYIHGVNCGLEVIGEGDDLEIIMLNTNKTGIGSVASKDYTLAHYKLGTATAWNGPATSAAPLSQYVDTFAVPVAGSAGIAWDDNGGFWFHSARANVVDQRGLCHVSPAGKVDFEFHATAADSAKYHIVTNGSNGGAGCRIIKQDGKDYLYVGMGRVQTNTVGRMVVYEIKYNAQGGVEDLETIYDMHLPTISTNLNDFAMDYGHNLYVVGNSNERLIALAMPYDGVNETPTQVEYVITGIENVQGDVKVQKIFRNGQIVIIKNGVEYNALGAQL